MTQSLTVTPGEPIRLVDFDPEDTAEFGDKEAAQKVLKRNTQRLLELQEVLWAQGKHAVLIVLQGMDASGKDGTIEHVFHGVNPQGCKVTSFKVPTREELDHDFLWRVHKAVPRRGMVGIFNRSHYEDVLVVRVENLAPQEVWSRRYEQINHFEKLLAETGTLILKFYLHISPDEQKKRFEERRQDPSKVWKFSAADVEKRRLWQDYMQAYEDAVNCCSTPWAPWTIVPANRKWYRNLVVSQALVDALEKLDMRYPLPEPGIGEIEIV
jgi:PPK2 family polyphosphate:nucleotide phosphotransferase